MKRRSLLLLSAVCGLSCLTGCDTTGGAGNSSYVPDTQPVYPGIASYVVMDAHDQHVVLAHAANARRPIASLTKIATAVVVLDFLRNSGMEANELMTVPPQVQLLGGPGAAGLQPGDQLTISDGLYAAMISSDNYAAETLAAHIGQKMVSQGFGSNPMSAFLQQMNGLASKVGLRDTRFANAHGLDLQRGYSTAADMAKLTVHALSVPGFSFYCSQPNRRISVIRGGQAQGVNISTTNELLFKGGIDGVKTGTTDLAGQCLILSAPKPSTVVKLPDNSTLVTQNRLVVVELGATDRFGQAWQLLNNGWTAYFAWRAAGSMVPGAPSNAVPAR
jgi:D-alanyl-D-alanine carboxypeptidase (penicillin-binding protein 5/6)